MDVLSADVVGVAQRRPDVQAGVATVIVGAWDESIWSAGLDICAGTLSIACPLAQVPSVNAVAVHPAVPVVYVGGSGGVHTMRVDASAGSLAEIDVTDSGGGSIADVALDAASMTLAVANYGGGFVATIPVAEDGELGDVASRVHGEGSGPLPRQDGSRPHGVVFAPDGRHVISADFGADRLNIYRFDRETKSLRQEAFDQPRPYLTGAGTGPRGLAFHPAMNIMYCVYEATAEVVAFRWLAQRAELIPAHRVALDIDETTAGRSGGALRISDDGRFLYCTNRGDHTLVGFEIDIVTGALTRLQSIETGGTKPWSFDIDATGRWVVVANWGSDSLAVLARDPVTGLLSKTGVETRTPKPVSVTICETLRE